MPANHPELDSLVDRCHRLATHAGAILAAIADRGEFSPEASASQALRRLQLSAVEMVIGHSLLWLKRVVVAPPVEGRVTAPAGVLGAPEQIAPFTDIGEPINALTEKTQQLVRDLARFAAGMEEEGQNAQRAAATH